MIENIPVYSYYICKNGSPFPSLQGGCVVHKHEAYLSEPAIGSSHQAAESRYITSFDYSDTLCNTGTV